MAIRQIVALRQFGFQGSQSDFRRILIEVKALNYPDISDEELTYTRDEADVYCIKVRARVGLDKLPRPFILRSLIGIRKNPMRV